MKKWLTTKQIIEKCEQVIEKNECVKKTLLAKRMLFLAKNDFKLTENTLHTFNLVEQIKSKTFEKPKKTKIIKPNNKKPPKKPIIVQFQNYDDYTYDQLVELYLSKSKQYKISKLPELAIELKTISTIILNDKRSAKQSNAN